MQLFERKFANINFPEANWLNWIVHKSYKSGFHRISPANSHITMKSALVQRPSVLKRSQAPQDRGKTMVPRATQSAPFGLPFPLPTLPLPGNIPSPAALQYSSVMALRVSYFIGQAALNSRVNNVTGSVNVPKIAEVVLSVLSGRESADSYKYEEVVNVEAPYEERSFWSGIMKSLISLLQTDMQNIERGVYKMPLDMQVDPTSAYFQRQWNPLGVLQMASDFMQDQTAVAARRAKKDGEEVRSQFSRPEVGGSPLPDYYFRNFHFQTDGFLSRESARRYDYQVETLFFGVADSMRRSALPHIRSFIEETGRDARDIKHLDIATGTGRFLAEVKHNFPGLQTTAVDLSMAYLEEAKDTLLKPYMSSTECIVANAEDLSMIPDNSQDLITCVYLFHELPPSARKNVAREMSRVLKTGGRIVLLDSTQDGDCGKAIDAALQRFPVSYHEPFYGSWIKTDAQQLFADVGCRQDSTSLAFVTKCFVFTKTTHGDVLGAQAAPEAAVVVEPTDVLIGE